MPTWNWEFTPRELLTFLFKNKVCPQCGRKLKRASEKMHMGKGWTQQGMGTWYGDSYNITIRYHCENCGTLYYLKDL